MWATVRLDEFALTRVDRFKPDQRKFSRSLSFVFCSALACAGAGHSTLQYHQQS